jgi:hypothetical protein
MCIRVDLERNLGGYAEAGNHTAEGRGTPERWPAGRTDGRAQCNDRHFMAVAFTDFAGYFIRRYARLQRPKTTPTIATGDPELARESLGPAVGFD